MGWPTARSHILVGTHAIFQQAVGYRKLGLAVVDEQPHASASPSG